MTMGIRHAETADGVALEVELDQHDRLAADDPAVVTRLDRHNLRRLVLDDAAVGVLDVDLAVREETDVRVHAEVGADGRLHVLRPPKAGRIDHPLDARLTGTPHFEPDVSDVAPLGAFHRRHQRVNPGRLLPRSLATSPDLAPTLRRLFHRSLLSHRHLAFNAHDPVDALPVSGAPLDRLAVDLE